ncbi:hypothetical protein [Plantactinospora soyae]|uniref:Uncharacterized protein n=1 Tax=Plantactinospora soyae TaxID=1544732 RepID=A0A927MD32_9ACTN|nr:hypothetical protein [Plantactinospora soyae]MBE1492382.1 hypothetical protein [Plantactinospora soyae]
MSGVVGMQVHRRERYPIIRPWAVLAAAAALAIGGCDSSPEPTETPEPRVTYGQATPDMCDRMRMAEVATRSGLKLRSSYDPKVHFDPRGSNVSLSCEIRAHDDSGRFRTEVGEFDPAGTVSLRTYPNHEDAEDAHKAEVISLRKFAESKPEVSIQDVSGWWDEGVYFQTVVPIEPQQYPRIEDLDAAGVEVLYELRHGNLRVTTRIDNRAATPEIDQVLAFLRNFAEAFTQEAVSHLSRTGPS